MARVRQCFSAEEAMMILALSFSSGRTDMLTWKFEKIGVYSAKSSYIEWMKRFEGSYVLPGERRWK